MEDSPKIYVASLSDYNSGSLKGKWFDLSNYSTVDELYVDIKSMLDSFGPGREEWAIHDFEGFPRSLYSEYMDRDKLQMVIDLAGASDRINAPMDVFYKWMDSTSNDFSDVESAIDKFNDAFVGTYDSPKDYAYSIAEESIASMSGDSGYMSESSRKRINQYYYTMLFYVDITDTDAREAAISFVDSEELSEEEHYQRLEEIENEISNDSVQFFLDMGYSSKQLLESAINGGFPYLFFDADKYWRDLSIEGYDSIYYDGQYYIFYE